MTRFTALALALSLSLGYSLPAFAAPHKVQVVQQSDGSWQLLRDGQPFTIKGAGGTNKIPELAAAGGNSIRTWGGADHKTDELLDTCDKNNVTVTVGIWLGHLEHGFKYTNEEQVKKQFEMAKATILKYKDNPAVLMWGLGNEMEGYGAGDDPHIWKAVNDIAVMAHELDPNHPCMTVIAEIGGKKVPAIHTLAPAVDIVGINSYGGCVSIPSRYKAAGGTKPYVITEFGPPGTWESGKNDFGVIPELTSTAKGPIYKAAYTANVVNNPGHCLGGYAFLWGFKQEATATWYGMYLPDGSKLEAVDAMTDMWSGKLPAIRCPQIQKAAFTTTNKAHPGDVLKAHVDVTDPQGSPLKIEWSLRAEHMTINLNGQDEAKAKEFPDAITKADGPDAEITAPNHGGTYRLFATIHDDQGAAATCNIPMLVRTTEEEKAATDAPKGEKMDLPAYVYGNGKQMWIPSGYMGDHAAIKMDNKDTTKPHEGTETSQKWTFDKPDGWGGVAWQSPVNDWGNKPGGYDLTGAKKLTFWARGEKGGEHIKFGVGLLGPDKKYHDTAKGEVQTDLTPDWKQYTIDLDGQDMTCIKTGFYWTLAGSGEPMTFYLSEIQYK